jgi:carbon-monoxide dehydrogenase medium subunit
LDEACNLLHDNGERAKALSGGQSLIPLMKLDLIDVEHLIDLKRLPGLSFVRQDGNSLVIGALTTHTGVERSPLIRQKVPLLSDTVRTIGYPQIRNRGTIGGSLANCDPLADLFPTLLALDATIAIHERKGGERKVGVDEFFRGSFVPALENGEIVSEIRVPAMTAGTGHSYMKLSSGTATFDPIVGVSALLEVDDGICKNAAVAIGCFGGKPFRVKQVEEVLLGKKLGDDEIVAASISVRDAEHFSGLKRPAEYTSRMAEVFTKRTLREALTRTRRC